MANNYTQFSEVLEELTEEEMAWLQATLEDQDDEERYRFLQGNPEVDFDNMGDCLGFDYELGKQEKRLYITGEEDGEPLHVATLVQQFLQKFRPTDCWWMTWAATCSKMRVGEFSGGAIFVTANEIQWLEASNWAWEQKKAHDARQAQDQPG